MSTSEARRGERNRLLLALSGSDYRRILPSLESFPLAAGSVLHRPHETITTVFFPQRCVVSELIADAEGGWVEVQTVGNEGVVGLAAFLGGGTGPTRAVARVPDDATRMSAAAFRRALRRSTPMRNVLLRYAQTVLVRLARVALCHRLHRLEARCAHSLLTTQDRVGGDRFLLTQASLAEMVGVRRSSIARAASELRRMGLIRYSRGRITIEDRPGLEAASCSCYQFLRADYAALVESDRSPSTQSRGTFAPQGS